MLHSARMSASPARSDRWRAGGAPGAWGGPRHDRRYRGSCAGCPWRRSTHHRRRASESPPCPSKADFGRSRRRDKSFILDQVVKNGSSMFNHFQSSLPIAMRRTQIRRPQCRDILPCPRLHPRRQCRPPCFRSSVTLWLPARGDRGLAARLAPRRR